MSNYKILVLGATFFMVALCPNVGMALTVATSGMAFYFLLAIVDS